MRLGHLVLLAGTLLVLRYRCQVTLRTLAWATLRQACSIVAGIAAGALVGTCMLLVAPMRWYALGQWVSFPLFLPPAYGMQMWVLHHGRGGPMAPLRPHEAAAGAVGVWWTLAGVLTIGGVRSGWIATWWLLNASCAFALCPWNRVQGSERPAHIWALYAALLSPAAMMSGRMAQLGLTMLMPLMGKSGTLLPADILIAAATSGLGIMAVLVWTPLLTLERTRIFAKGMALLTAVAVLCALPLPPYTTTTPKRIWLQHVYKTIGGEYAGSGLWLTPFDSQALKPFQTQRVPRLDGRHVVGCDPDGPQCMTSYPYYFPIGHHLRTSWWLPVDPPPLPPERRLVVTHRTKWNMVWGTCEVSLVVRGPDHMAMVIDDHMQGQRLRSWSLAPEIPAPRDEGVYYAQMTTGGGTTTRGACDPACEWEVSFSLDGAQAATVSIAAHYLDLVHTDEIDLLYTELPPWAAGAEWAKFVSAVDSIEVAAGGCKPSTNQP